MVSNNIWLHSISKILYYTLLSVVAHALVILLFAWLISLDFSPDEYELLEIQLDKMIPVVLEEPPPEVVPQVVEQVERVNETVEVVDEKDDEEEEEDVQEVQEVVPTPSDNAEVGVEYVPFYSADRRPSFKKKATQIYPLKEKKQGKEGVVIIEVDIDAKGVLRDYRILNSAGENFDRATINMITNSSYNPGFKAGVAIPVRMRFTVRYKLTN